MNFRAEFQYHVMNLKSGTIVHSTHSELDAREKALSYATNGGSPHSVLEEVARTKDERKVTIA